MWDGDFVLALCHAPEQFLEESLHMNMLPIFLQLLPKECVLTACTRSQGTLCSWSHWTIIVGFTQKGTPTSFWLPSICGYCQGHLYITWLWWPVGLALVSPAKTVTNGERVLK